MTLEQQLGDHLQYINMPTAAIDNSLSTIVQMRRFDKLHGLFSRLLCTPAILAPVERVFFQNGLLLRPHRAQMSDTVLETLVFLKCNNAALGHVSPST